MYKKTQNMTFKGADLYRMYVWYILTNIIMGLFSD